LASYLINGSIQFFPLNINELPVQNTGIQSNGAPEVLQLQDKSNYLLPISGKMINLDDR
jgi:hypothetical protein